MIEIRQYRHEDIEQLLPLVIELQRYEQQYDADRVISEGFAGSYVTRLLADIQERKGILLVAINDRTACGFIAGYAEEEVANQNEFFYISDLVVAETHRGQGVGSRLIQAIESFAKARGFKRLGIGVLAGSENVHRLYRNMGFRDYAIEMMKNL